MTAPDQMDDLEAIKRLIGAHFDGLRWNPGTRPDWETFAADFLPDASLYGAARPVRRQTLKTFIARMNGLVGSTLHPFEEKTIGMQVTALWWNG